MTYSRKFEHTDDHGDTLYASHTTWTNDEDEKPETTPDEHIMIRTRGGRPIFVPMRVAREFASWLLEHAIGGEGSVVAVPAGHGVAMFGGGGNGGAGGAAYAGVGGAGNGGRGGNGGSATIVQRTV